MEIACQEILYVDSIHSFESIEMGNSGRPFPAPAHKTHHACAEQSAHADWSGRRTPRSVDDGTGAPGTRRAFSSAMPYRPKRTFRQRRANSSDSDDAQEPCEEAGTPGQPATPGQEEEEPPSSGQRAEVTERTLKIRARRMRGRVWASSRRAGGTAPQTDVCAGAAGDSGGLRHGRGYVGVVLECGRGL